MKLSTVRSARVKPRVGQPPAPSNRPPSTTEQYQVARSALGRWLRASSICMVGAELQWLELRAGNQQECLSQSTVPVLQ